MSPYFSEDVYKGQDVVHYGVRIPLDVPFLGWEIAFKKTLAGFSRRARRIIEKSEGKYKVIALEQEHLSLLRTMWFDTTDPTFPREMGEHIGVVILDEDGYVLGGAIWAQSGNQLFLHQLVSSKEGKKLGVPTIAIWESYKRFAGHQWHALDIGVSYNPKRYEFFKNFAVETYPIILKAPHQIPVIRLSPFRSIEPLQKDPVGEFSGKSTFLPRGNYALYAALKHIGVKEGDEVVIVKTFGSDFITGCVTSTIEKTGANWTLRRIGIKDNTKAVVCLHEFGIPVFQELDIQMLKWARNNGIPIIEDCAWRNSRVFDFSQYGVFSFQKLYNMNYGGLLTGVRISDDVLWSWGCLDVVKRDRYLRELEETVSFDLDKRKYNWNKYHGLVLQDGMMPDDCYEYEKAVNDGTWMPTVYLQKFKDDDEANAIVQRLEEFGIQAGRYWGEPVVYLPIHQNMSEEEVEYMFAVVRGYFNLCRDWGLKK